MSGRIRQADRLHHAVEHLAVVDLHHIVAALNPQLFQRVGGHHADFGIRRDAGRAHRIRVELHELPKTAGAGLFVPEDVAGAIGAIGFRQLVVVLSDIAGERRGQVVAQRQPLLVVILKGEDALVRAVLIRQEFSQRVGIFDERRLDRLEAVEFVGLADFREHALGCREFGRATVGEAARLAGFDFVACVAHAPGFRRAGAGGQGRLSPASPFTGREADLRSSPCPSP